MRSLFKELQKSHMKQLKAEGKHPEGEGVATHPRKRGFVKDSLVKVELEGKWEEPRREELKVRELHRWRCSLTIGHVGSH